MSAATGYVALSPAAAASPWPHERIIAGNVLLHTGRNEAVIGGRAWPLSPSMFRVLRCLLRRPGRVASHEILANVLYGPDAPLPQAVVVIAVLVSRLRALLAAADATVTIRTAHTVGYVLETEDHHDDA